MLVLKKKNRFALSLQLHLTPSVLGHVFTTSVGCDEIMLLTLGTVYKDQKCNGQSLLLQSLLE